MKTIGEIIQGHRDAEPDRIAVVALGKDPLSYAALHQQINVIRAKLRRGGFGPQARIGLAFLEGPDAVPVVLALACHATMVPINGSFSDDELRQMFEQARLDAVVVPQAGANIRAVAHGRGLAIIEAAPSQGRAIACSLQVPEAPRASEGEATADGIAVILQTSGTTGRPKLLPLTHANFIAEAGKMRDWFDLTPKDRSLSFLPLYYAHGLRETLFPAIITGGSVARPHDAVQLKIADWLGHLQPTWYSTFPIFHQSIFGLISAAPDRRVAHTLRFIMSAGTPLKPALKRGLEDGLGVPLLEFYGIGEAGHMSANLLPPGPRKDGTCGIPKPGEMMIALDGEAVPAGELGEVLLRSPSVISGYLDNPHANADAFAADGWFRTGDLGMLDRDGFLTIHGRLKEIINRGGEKLSPIEVERVLLRHPAVLDAAACGIPHPRLGDEVAAAVILRDSAAVTPSELRSFARRQLAAFKVPRVIATVASLPKDITGKIQRRELSRMLSHASDEASGGSSTEPYCPLMVELLDVWRGLLQRDSIGVDEDFFALGGDSLLAVQMRLAVEKRTGLTLSDALPFEAPTIRQLTQAIAESSQAGEMQILAEWSDRKDRPFFFFHGDFISGGLYVRHFVELMGHGSQIISVAPHGLNGEGIPCTIEQMARERLPLILAAQPVGPFRLGGHCNGGAVAFEVARLLQDAGHRVEMLALVDVPMMNVRLPMRILHSGLGAVLRVALPDAGRRDQAMAAWMSAAWKVYEKSRRFRQSTPEGRKAKINRRLSSSVDVLRQIAHRLRPGAGRAPSTATLPDETLARKQRYFRALASYVPRRLDTTIIYYAAEHSGRHARTTSADLRVVQVPGGHFGCITTHVGILADDLRDALDGERQGPLVKQRSALVPELEGTEQPVG